MIGAARAQPFLNVRLDFLSIGAIGQRVVEVHLHKMPPVTLRTFNADVGTMFQT